MIDLALPLRAVQILFAVISLGLNGYLCHWYRVDSFYKDSPSIVNFLIFTSLWTLLISPILLAGPRFLPRIFTKVVELGLDALTWLLWLSGWAAMTHFKLNLVTCWGRICHTMTAAIVFGAFEWILFTATVILAALQIWRGQGSRRVGGAKEMNISPPISTV